MTESNSSASAPIVGSREEKDPALLSALEMIERSLPHWIHSEAVSECLRCNVNYIVKWARTQSAARDAREGTPAEQEHFCSGCHHRWQGPSNGAGLCGDCWRKAQRALFGGTGEMTTIPRLRQQLDRLQRYGADYRYFSVADVVALLEADAQEGQ
jgi:hypothetical protein